MVLCFCLLWGSGTPVKAAPAALTSLTFDADYYYNTYPDLQAALGYDYNSLYQHYLTSGLAEGRSGSAEFNCLVYRNNYPDLQAAFGNDYRAYCAHYEAYGKAEGRNAAGNGMALSGAADTAASAEAAANTLIGSYATPSWCKCLQSQYLTGCKYCAGVIQNQRPCDSARRKLFL